jgi:hypothetical protein
MYGATPVECAMLQQAEWWFTAKDILLDFCQSSIHGLFVWQMSRSVWKPNDLLPKFDLDRIVRDAIATR